MRKNIYIVLYSPIWKIKYYSKTLLQEEIQKNNTAQLRYELVGETGPDHDKEFSVEAYLDEKLIGTGVGRTKKAAEQQAAYEALVRIKGKKR